MIDNLLIFLSQFCENFQGCSSPLVVKFADTQKEKDQKRMQQLQSNLWNIAGVNIAPHYLAVSVLNILQWRLFGPYQRFHLHREREYGFHGSIAWVSYIYTLMHYLAFETLCTVTSILLCKMYTKKPATMRLFRRLWSAFVKRNANAFDAATEAFVSGVEHFMRGLYETSRERILWRICNQSLLRKSLMKKRAWKSWERV